MTTPDGENVAMPQGPHASRLSLSAYIAAADRCWSFVQWNALQKASSAVRRHETCHLVKPAVMRTMRYRLHKSIAASLRSLYIRCSLPRAVLSGEGGEARRPRPHSNFCLLVSPNTVQCCYLIFIKMCIVLVTWAVHCKGG